jgi:formylglycine-generating enzyme required for sulfatase activity
MQPRKIRSACPLPISLSELLLLAFAAAACGPSRDGLLPIAEQLLAAPPTSRNELAQATPSRTPKKEAKPTRSASGPRERTNQSANASGDSNPRFRTNSQGMKLALIPAGTFVMGTPEGETSSPRRFESPHKGASVTNPRSLECH